MTEQQAWLKLAEGVGVRYISGLCPAIAHYPEFKELTAVTRGRMLERIAKLHHRAGLWVWPHNTLAGNRARAAYCLRQAARLSRKRARIVAQ